MSGMPQAGEETFALLAAQEDMALDALLHPHAPTNTLANAVRLDAPIDAERMHRAVNAAIAEIAAWRRRFHVVGNEVRQSLRERLDVPVPLIDLSGDADPQATARSYMDEAAREVFPLEADTLFRIALLRLAADRHVLLLTYSHLLTDGAISSRVVRRTGAHYAADRVRPEPLPPSKPILDVLADETAYRASSAAETDHDYWRARLAELPVPLVDAGPRDGVRGRHGREAVLRDIVPARAQVEQAAAQLEVAPFRVILTLATIALLRVHDRDAVTVDVHVHNRDAAALQHSDANLAGRIPFLADFAPSASLLQAIKQVDRTLSQDRAHRRTRPRVLRGLLGTTGVDASVNYVPAISHVDFGGIAGWSDFYASGFFQPWKIDLRDSPDGDGYFVQVFYDATLIPTALASAVSNALRCLLQDCAQALDIPIGQLRILAPEQEAMLLEQANGTVMAMPGPAVLTSLIAAQASRCPAAVAVQDAINSLNYDALMARVVDLAAVLTGAGVGSGKIVALALPRGVGLVVAVLAVQQAGAAFLPIDPEHPADRIAWMLADAAACLALTTREMAGHLPGDIPKLYFDSALDGPRGVPVPPGPDDLAYVLYTSGSTGRPKAVMVAQRSIANLALWGSNLLDADALAGMLFSTPLVFDVSMFELFAPLVGGGRVLVAANLLALPGFALRNDVRVISGVPTILEALLRAGGIPEGVRVVVPAGEALSRDLAERLFAARPGLRLVNAYGPTEATVYASSAEIRPGDSGPVPIGTALPNMALYVLDRHARLLPPGVAGELHLGGAGVAEGYLNRADLTAERFISNPFGEGRLYRTGDRAEWRDDKQVGYLGRADGQVKLHGVRIEVGEVEAALRALPSVAAAAVGLHGEADAKRLVAWIVPDGPEPTQEALRLELGRALPSAMIPTAFVMLSALPVTVSGKLDRAALPAPTAAASRVTRRGPTTQMQRALFDLWRDVIDVPEIRNGNFGIDDDLFDLGGDSLIAVLLFAEIEIKLRHASAGRCDHRGDHRPTAGGISRAA